MIDCSINFAMVLLVSRNWDVKMYQAAVVAVAVAVAAVLTEHSLQPFAINLIAL